MRWIDNFLNRITMYRLLLYYLLVLVVVAAVCGLFGWMAINPASLAFSTLLILTVCWGTNWLFAWAFDAATNAESFYLTALILALIISPVAATNLSGVGFLIFASVWAMASKYIIAIGKKHVFNPAAFAVALCALAIGHSATWWVGGNLQLLPFVVLGGLLVLRKIERFDLFFSFALFSLAAVAIPVMLRGGSGLTSMEQLLLHSSFFFLGFVMLTEPMTAPPSGPLRIIYGALVGFLFAPWVHVGGVYSTPELSLLLGNVFSYIVSPKGRFMLTLKRIEQSASDIYDFVFSSDRPFSFLPGQYLEWTLAHRGGDTRGNRRYFTIASSPTEEDVRMGVKFYEKGSSFKHALATMQIGGTIAAGQLAGSFILPKDPNQKLVFVAGGIGITPFRSMVQYLLDRGERRPIVMFYSNNAPEDVAYKDIFDRAELELGIKTIYALTSPGAAASLPGVYQGRIDAAHIEREVPDYRERTFYISGPRAMVESFKITLRQMGVSRFKIKTDFFPGFV